MKITCTCQAKVDREREQLNEAQFGLVLNWAFVTQSSMPPLVIKEEDILIQERGNVLRMVKTEVKIEFFLHPAV